MSLNKITGGTLRKMVMQASGTKGYVSSSVQKHLQTTGAKRFLKDNAPVTKQQAIKIMKGLKVEGLAHKVTSDATTYVKKGFAKEERRQEMVRKQNVGERAKEISAEKQAEAATAALKAGTTGKKPICPAQMVTAQVVGAAKTSIPTTNDFVGNSFGSTNVKLAPLSPNLGQTRPASQVPKKTEEDLIDMVID